MDQKQIEEYQLDTIRLNGLQTSTYKVLITL